MTADLERLLNEVRLLWHVMLRSGEQLHASESVTLGMRAVLEFLSLNGSSTVPQMARQRSVSRQHIQALVDALLKQRMVNLIENPAHKRSVLMTLTPLGQATFERMKRRELRLYDKTDLGTSRLELRRAAKTLETVRLALRSAEQSAKNKEASRDADNHRSEFGKPSGVLGEVAGLIMTLRPSNRERNERTLELLDIRPDDEVLEIGFGPGLGIQRAAELAYSGRVAGIDHSELMLRWASRRNAEAIASGKVGLRLGSVEQLPNLGLRFNKVFAVNVYMFWKDPVVVLRAILAAMKPGGTLALTLQPRKPGATSKDTQAAADRMAASIRAAGFGQIRIHILKMKPVDAACVIGQAPTGSLRA